MTEMVAYCGLVCSECPTYLATLKDDNTAREKTATLYAEKSGLHFKPEDINCDGCQSEGGRLLVLPDFVVRVSSREGRQQPVCSVTNWSDTEIH